MKKIAVVLLALLLAMTFAVGCRPDGGGTGTDPDGEGDGPFTISFVLNGGEGKAPADQTLYKDGKIVAPAQPSRDGYEFAGWYTAATGGTVWTMTTDLVKGNLTLYAHWTIINQGAKQEYENNLASWSKSGHTYFHYKRFKNTQADYKDWTMWVWQRNPNNGEGRTFATSKLDESGAIYDIDMTHTYPDGGKTGNIVVDYEGTTELGFLLVYEPSKGASGSHWQSDGGNIFIDGFDTKTRPDGSVHVYVNEGNASAYKMSYVDTVEEKDPYEGIAPGSATSAKGNNVESSKAKYKQMPTSPEFLDTAGVGYQIQVSSFADSDGDGFGDIRGITENLDYLKDTVHVNVLWLTPIQLSNSYHGYDIIDFLRVDPRFGSMSDYRDLIFQAHKRGMKVLMDFVVNHTSTNNIWFEKSTKLKKGIDKNGNEIDYRNFYNWINEAEYNAKADKTPWHAFSTKGYYYYSKFNDTMPELNYDYQPVRDAMADIAKYWLAFGLDGFRIDAVKHVYMEGEYSTPSAGDEITIDTSGYSRNLTKNVNFFMEFSAQVKSVYPNTFIVGENWEGDPTKTYKYAKGMDSQFNFNVFYDIARSIYNPDRGTPDIFAAKQVTTLNGFKAYRTDPIDSPFTSNHDVSRAVNHLFAVNDNDAQSSALNAAAALPRTKVWGSVIMTLPGLSWIYYGDELGMSGNKGDTSTPHGDRWVRQPFKWTTAGKTGGSKYTTGYSFESYTIEWEPYNAVMLGAAEQKAKPDSLLNHYSSLNALKSTDKVLIRGEMKALTTTSKSVMAFSRSYDGKTYYIYHNLGGSSVNISMQGSSVKWSGNGGAKGSLPAYSSVIMAA